MNHQTLFLTTSEILASQAWKENTEHGRWLNQTYSVGFYQVRSMAVAANSYFRFSIATHCQCLLMITLGEKRTKSAEKQKKGEGYSVPWNQPLAYNREVSCCPKDLLPPLKGNLTKTKQHKPMKFLGSEVFFFAHRLSFQNSRRSLRCCQRA